ncbi:MAG: hypothetical protein KAR20_12900, partial [Candidatus Heimdallarchaeota archaeon]|nr:hypothetical protein [Candidatus Heimdallarchaeota archaeon]
KEYSEGTLELCPVPLERRDSVSIEEWISDSKSIWHRGNIRHLKLKVTKTMQTITLIIEE